MALQLSSSNYAPTPAGALRLREFIKAQNQTLKEATSKVLGHQMAVSTCNSNIWGLKTSISQKNPILKQYIEDLQSLMVLEKHTNQFSPQRDDFTPEDDEAKTLYYEIKSNINSTLKTMRDQIMRLERIIQVLTVRIREMELELEDWVKFHTLCATALEQETANMENVNASLMTAIQAVKTMWAVPVEIWREIFRLVVEMEFDKYVKEPRYTPFRPAAIILSQVCQSWRRICNASKELWNFITAHPTENWPQHKYDLFTSCIAKGQSPVTIIVNLSQVLDWTYSTSAQTPRRTSSPRPLFNSHGVVVEIASPKWNEVLIDNDYRLVIKLSGDTGNNIGKMAHLPFQTPSAITLISDSPLKYNLLLNRISRFKNVTSLSVIDDEPVSVQIPSISSVLPRLTRLYIAFKKFPVNFSLYQFLSPTIEELHLRHEVPEPSPQLSEDIQLPKLRILGVTLQCLPIIEKLNVPAIEELTLYSSFDSQIGLFSSHTAGTVYGRVKHVEFVGWHNFIAAVEVPATESESRESLNQEDAMEGRRSTDAVQLFAELATKASRLNSAQFTDSWVDGEALVRVVDTVWSVPETDHIPNFEQVTLLHPTGVTRNQCDRLKPMIKRLNIYM